MRIGIDVGGSHIGLGLVDSKGNLLLKEEKDYETEQINMSDVVLNTIKQLIKQVIESKDISLEEIESIGIAFPGTVSEGKVIKAENLGLENFEIVKELKKEFKCDILLQNDAKCAAIAEKYIGSLKKYDDCLFLILGTGVGGAVYLEGKLLKPKRYSAFEVGHMIINKDGERCNCGRRGCFETYGSMKRLKQKIKEQFNLSTIDGKSIKAFIF